MTAVRHSGGKTRRRGDALEHALLDAAWDELQAVGYAGLTIEAVADRAGTSRAVLYRRWFWPPCAATGPCSAARSRTPAACAVTRSPCCAGCLAA
jgi:hypothetical protein